MYTAFRAPLRASEQHAESVLSETMQLPGTAADVIDMASRAIAGGVVSMNRKVTPQRIFRRALGSKLWDIDGKEYIDYHAAFAPYILGHNFPEVNDAVKHAMEDGWSLMGSGTTPWEALLAQMIREAVPSLDLVQISNSGSEAVSLALRLAQAFTGREEVIVTLGGYNGWQNEVARVVMPTLQQLGPRVSPGEYPFLPASAGIPAEVAKRVHVVNFNDLPSMQRLLETGRISCVLTEPALQNVGVILPQPGYLASVLELCERHGTVCVFDEIKTGFRSGLGGYQGVAGLRPHLSVFGKALANGFPISAIGGRADIMQLFDAPDPARRVLIAGTYNAHPLVCAAGIATLSKLRDPATYTSIRRHSSALYQGLRELFTEAGIAATLVNNESAYCVYFCEQAPRDLHDILEHHDFDFDLRLRKALLERGIYHIPISCKQGSISYSHSAADVARTLDMTRDAIKSL